MPFNGNENHDIPLSEATAWTANYRNANPGQVKAHYFGENAIKAIFDQAGCVGMRIYYALDDAGEKQLIIVGVNADGNDLYNGLLAERSTRCPQACPTASPLNN